MIWTDRGHRATPALTVLLAGLLLASGPASARPPLSASDWLSGSIQQPDNISAWRPGDARPPELKSRNRKDVAKSGAVEPVGVTRLGESNPDSKGSVSAHAAGLPENLWGASDALTIAHLIRSSDARLPALRRLQRRILAAQLAAPSTPSGGEGQLFLARVDKLLDMGATGAAKELIKTAGPADPARFRRLFDIALLSGDEAHACEIMDLTPGVAPSFPARIFCLALGGDWSAAALVFHGAETSGLIDPRMAQLLAQYLDDGYSDSTVMLDPPEVVTPLDLRLHDAIGQPLPAANLPLAFSLSDLDQNGGWKSRLDAAERLARAGAIPASQLRQIYLEQRPAASGGVWDRADAIQRLDAVLTSRDTAAVQEYLPKAFDLMVAAGLGSAFADMVGARSASLPLEGRAGQISLWLTVEAGQWQAMQDTAPDAQPFDLWLLDFASGLADAKPPAGQGSDRAERLITAFRADADLPPVATQLINEKKQGEAMLLAIADTDAGLDGDLTRAAHGLRVLRELDQGEIARQAAIELMLAPVIGSTPGALATSP
ncbi:hypothetical protein [Paracoccus aestuariivivens]|uniref:Antifreeze glycopeptide n=1 Tax=Paracoccus aestuariivivens TaxID=1820333 RepID=A0A6L6JF80_9RHOB|nr:hypothetical protein [Paracoccus aestuariivivens]MTH79828.1 hypothetical protein [Paracoccus aestuariivivens]